LYFVEKIVVSKAVIIMHSRTSQHAFKFLLLLLLSCASCACGVVIVAAAAAEHRQVALP